MSGSSLQICGMAPVGQAADARPGSRSNRRFCVSRRHRPHSDMQPVCSLTGAPGDPEKLPEPIYSVATG